MEIDLFTFAAQVVNFLVLVFLLKKFLFKRIVSAMDERERRIAADLAAAEENHRASAEEADASRSLRREIEQKRAADAAGIESQNAALRLRLEAEARSQVETERAQWFDQLTKEEKSLTEEIAGRSGDLMLSVLRKAFADLADETLENRMADMFMKKMFELDSAWIAPGASYTVASGFALDETHKTRIRDMVLRLAGNGSSVGFVRRTDLLCGIELAGGGKRISWNLDGYLDKLKETIPFPAEARP